MRRFISGRGFLAALRRLRVSAFSSPLLPSSSPSPPKPPSGLPVVLPALAWATGILLLQAQPVLPVLPWSWGLLALPGLLPGRQGRPAPTWRLLLAVFLLGFAWSGWRAELRLGERLDPALEGVDLLVVGLVAALPQENERGQRLEFALESLSTVADGEIPATRAGLPPRILLNHYRRPAAGDAGPLRGAEAGKSEPVFRVGERWRLTIRLKQAHGNANPGSFDYEAWLFERGLRATGYIRPGAPGQTPQRLAEFVSQPWLHIERWREHIRTRMQNALPQADYPAIGILVALAIGDQRAIAPAEWQIFSRTGTTHLMSISGLHVTMLAALVGALVAAIWRRWPFLALRWPAQRAGMAAAAAAGVGYALLAGFSVPAQRTACMLLIAALAALGKRQPAPSRILALALLAVLILDPWAVRAPGFWLSFGAVAALFWIARTPTATAGWQQGLGAWGRTQWAATLASLPVVLLVFQQLSLVSPLANALAIPLVSFAIAPLALVAAFLGDNLPGNAALLLAHALLSGLLQFLAFCAKAPLWQPPAPPWPVAALAALGVLVALLPRGLPGRGLGFCLLLPALYWPAPRPPTGAAWIDVLDVGQGLSVVVRTEHHNLVYDPGPLYGPEADAGERVLLPFLRFSGVDRVHRLVVSHRDSDHAGGTASLLAALPVDDLRSSFAPQAAQRCRAGEEWQWDGVDFAFLHPAAAAYTVDGQKRQKTNHLSCVLRIAAAGRVLLLTGDIEAADEITLLASARQKLLADILLVPHHGSKTSSTPAFIAAVAPLHAIFTVGYRNRFGHPKPEILSRYTPLGTRLWRSDRDGRISIQLERGGSKVDAYRNEARHYWQQERLNGASG